MAENTVSQNTPAVKTNATISVEFIGENVPAVLSTEVAIRFQKKHKHILDEIRRIQSITPKSFHEPNFRPMSVEVEIGNGATRKDPAYLLTRDGFSLLAMGFTGKAAIMWKLRYIEAFNALEAAVLDNARAAALEQGVRAAFALSPERRAMLEKVLKYHKMGLTSAETGKLLDRKHSVVSDYLCLGRRLGLLEAAPKTAAQRAAIHANLQKGRAALAAAVAVAESSRRTDSDSNFSEQNSALTNAVLIRKARGLANGLSKGA